MRTKNRFIKSVLKTANETSVEMPWSRGSRRVSFSNRRPAQAA